MENAAAEKVSAANIEKCRFVEVSSGAITFCAIFRLRFVNEENNYAHQHSLRDADDKPFHGQAARNRLHKAGDESVRLFEKPHDIPKMHAHRRQFVAAKPFAHRMTNIVEARI